MYCKKITLQIAEQLQLCSVNKIKCSLTIQDKTSMIKNGDFLASVDVIYYTISNIHWTSTKVFFYMGNNILCQWIPSVLLYSLCKVTGTLFHMDTVTNMEWGVEGGIFFISVAVSLLRMAVLLGPISTSGLLRASSAPDPSLLQPTQGGPPELPGSQQPETNGPKNLMLKLTNSSAFGYLGVYLIWQLIL